MSTIGARRRTRTLQSEPKKERGYTTASFTSMMIFAIILGIAVIVLLVLYFRRDATLINPNECPEGSRNTTVRAGVKIAETAFNCASNPTCIYTVGSLSAAETICTDLGPMKCAAFSMEQIASSENFTMTVSSGTSTIANVSADTYILP